MTLHKPLMGKKGRLLSSHAQAFLKRLRKAQKTNNIKYYLAGEYGSDRDRPHYHIIMFNISLSTLIGESMARLSLRDPQTFLNGKYHFDCKHWSDPQTKNSYGAISIGTVTKFSIEYALKYISKPQTIPKHENDDRKKEFSIMSKGLGKSYITDNAIQWHKSDLIQRMYLPIGQRFKIAMPRYYKKKIYTDLERELIGVHLSDYEEKQYEKLTQQEKKDKKQKRINEVLNNIRKLARGKYP